MQFLTLAVVVALALISTPVHIADYGPVESVQAFEEPPEEPGLPIPPIVEGITEEPEEEQTEELPEILIKISKCESGGRQFEDDGTPLKGKLTPKEFGEDIGELQINEKYWGAKAIELGFDIRTLNGNRKMGKWIYEREGTKPWNASRHCWNK